MSEKPNPTDKLPDPVDLSRAVARIAERSHRIVADFVSRQGKEGAGGDARGGGSLGMGDPMNVASAFLEMTTKLMVDPTPLVHAQVSLWNDYMRLWQHTAQKLMGVKDGSPPVIEPAKGDKRFKNQAWEENPAFDFIKQSYLLTARVLQRTVKEVEGLDDKTARKVDFYTRQFVDAMAPSNFVLTNPEVLQATIESGGDNLIRGLENMLSDLERGKGQLNVRMTDLDAFKIGENLATTPGKVIFQNDLMQLIQYAPTTEMVRRRPLLIVPPWINKFYILDLRPANSFIRWAVEQGHTVFVISWVNPNEALAQKEFVDYMDEGPLAALGAIEKATGEREVNVIGYCIGGTLLATTLAYMAARGDHRFTSATYFTALVDFTEVGELSVFIDEEQLHALEGRMEEKGYLQGRDMATTFNMLRANDLIWSFVVNNYLMGKEPFPFDLLYWNSDATRMPHAMHSFYLRNMYQENRLIRPGGISVHGQKIDITKIHTPSFLLATKEDHIAPWRSSYSATQFYKGPVKFCLAGSGHVAGVVNAPSVTKYGYWTNPKLPKSPDAWFDGATQNEGSWWPEWDTWIAQYGGELVPKRIPGSGKLKPIEDAPGAYVKMRDQ